MRSSIPEDVSLRGYLSLLRRHRLSLVLLMVLGTLAGVGLQVREGTPVEAQQRVFVRDIRNGDSSSGGELATIDFSLDTEAQLIRSPGVIGAIQEASTAPMTPEEALSRLQVTALPNTRILVLHVTLPSAVKATEAVQNAGRAYLQARSALMNSSRAAQLTLLRQREDDLSNIVAKMNATVPTNRNYRTDVTKAAIGRYANELQYVETTRTRLANNPLDVGQLVGQTSTAANHDGLLIKGSSGLILGLALWAMLATLFDGAFRRVGRRRRLLPWVRRRVAESDVPIIGRVHLAGTGDELAAADPALAEAKAALLAFGPISAVLSPIPDPDARRVANVLDGLSRDPDPGTSGRVALVAPSSTRVEAVHALERRSRAAGLDPVGVIVVDE
jgi:capsular polysaccharide biosynthesis protein